MKALTILTFAAPDLRGLVLGDEETRSLLHQFKLLFLGDEAIPALATLPATPQIQALLRPFVSTEPSA